MLGRLVFKRLAQMACLVIALTLAAISILSRIQTVHTVFAHLLALGPGLIGSYLRAAYYKFTLRELSLDTTINFGSYFVLPVCSIGSRVSVGSFCVVGLARIGMGTQIGSHVMIPSGRHQHARDEHGNLSLSKNEEIRVGEQCWIGDGAIVMADVGDGTTIGAGIVVTKPLSARAVAVGNPACVIQEQSAS